MIGLLIYAAIAVLFIRVAMDANSRGFLAKFVVSFGFAWVILYIVDILGI